jgi:hypothetical protein
MFSIEMMAAEYGDALWIEYGKSSAPRIVAIDGGPQTNGSPLYTRLHERAQGGTKVHVELLIVTHIDADHINGALAALRSLPPTVSFGDIWFNGFKHLVPRDLLGPEAGEQLSRHLVKSGLPWNDRLQQEAVVVPTKGELPAFDFEGLHLTLLSPTPDKLARLHKVWKSVIQKAGMAVDALGEIPLDEREAETDGPDDLLGRSDTWPPDVRALADRKPKLDGAEANGSSIGILAEYREGGRTYSALLAADCHAPVLESSLDRLLAARDQERLKLDAFKLAHHGSRHNLTNGLLERLSCRRYLISTSGKRFSHPDHEALARVVVKGGPEPTLLFNYDTPRNLDWKKPLSGAPAFKTRHGDGSLLVPLV